MLRSRFVHVFSIKGYDIRVNKPTIRQFHLLKFPCCLGHCCGEIDIAPDGTTPFLITALLFDLHSERSGLPLHSFFLVSTNCAEVAADDYCTSGLPLLRRAIWMRPPGSKRRGLAIHALKQTGSYEHAGDAISFADPRPTPLLSRPASSSASKSGRSRSASRPKSESNAFVVTGVGRTSLRAAD
ncbi:hypothetical protein IQ26_05836 [Mesorhizobium tianshanense]|uniref:Uncharacterized protein n=1 Tax=Mesorhizobium tianshanense TaxID=39844 RepID=A0A562N3V5_9HYPH|nr:hypothetical protein IQ26_05836 [Mesorhizobium tianshanense]